MKVKCKNNNDCEATLKIGKTYIVQAELKEKFKIKLNSKESGIYLKGRFKEVEE